MNIDVYPMFTPTLQKTRKPLIIRGSRSAFVIPLGLEPRTHTLKVYCSTN